MKLGKSIFMVLMMVNQMYLNVAIAQDDLFEDTEEVLESPQIDINGKLKKETAADRIAKMRKKLEEQNEQMMQKKIEDVRIKQEHELSQQLQRAFKRGFEQVDQVSTGQSSVQKVEVAAPVVIAPPKEAKNNKIIPFLGISHFYGEGIDGFESNANVGLSFESEVNERFSVGVGAQYTSMSITDTTNSFGSNYYGPQFNLNTAGDEIEYKRINLSVNSKLYLTTETKIRPFVGAGVGYNRSSMEYAKKQSSFQTTYGNNFSDSSDSISGSHVNGVGLVGAEVSFNDTVGMCVDFRYTKSFTNGFESTNDQSSNYVNYNEVVLRNLGSSIEDSSEASLNLGMIVKF